MKVTQSVLLQGRPFTIIKDGVAEIFVLENDTPTRNQLGWFPRGWIFYSRRDAEHLGRQDEPGFASLKGAPDWIWQRGRELKQQASRQGLAGFAEQFAEEDHELALAELEVEDGGAIAGAGEIAIDSGQAEIIPLDRFNREVPACDQRQRALAAIRVADDGVHRVKLIDGPANLRPAFVSKGAHNGARVWCRCLHWLPANDYAVADSGCGVAIHHTGGYLKSFMVNRTLYLCADGLKQL